MQTRPSQSSASGISKKVTFPDQSSFPIQSIFDAWEGYTQICYMDSDLPQILWVPNDFINQDGGSNQ